MQRPSGSMMQQGLHQMGGSSGGGAAPPSDDRKLQEQEMAQLVKVEIAIHPMFEQLLGAHVGCLRVATPIDHLPLIDAQLGQSHHLLRSYASQHRAVLSHQEKQELDQFLAQYMVMLCSFKEQLQHHVRVHAVDAVMACNEIEKSLHDLTGVTLEEGTGASMSDEEDDDQHLDYGLDADPVTPHDMTGFGPLLPTESERTLMERVRQELKHELKQGFRSRIEDVREEILRKRRAGKLAGDATTILQQWWQQHSKWPYPTEDEKAKLVEETGLQLKQINNWFINRRKRNWHNNSQSATFMKSKRKR